MALRIRIEHGQDAGKTYRLASAGVYRVGRSPQGSFQVLDMKVSKEHFEIAHDPEHGTTIRDLSSSHGTFLNGQKVGDARTLSPGDEVRLGLTILRVLSDGAADADAKLLGPLTASTPAANNGSLSASTPAAHPGSVGASSKATLDDPLVGTTLAGYRVLERVGAGGMGAVYRAEQLSLHREVALKVLAEKLVSDSAFVDQFVNEARAAGALNHPNVVQVYDVGQADGRHFFSMEFIHGGSLEDKIPRGKTVSWEEALPWFLDAANALIFAEKKGILHRDIKPDNLMLGQDGSVKLCDLGLAKKSESVDLLAQGIIGTPHFIAPEAIRRKTDVDRRADLYSLGCSIYRLLAGKNPYPGSSVKEILLAHLNQPVPRVSAVVDNVPKELDDVVFRLMQKDAAARFQSATELWEALDKIRLQFGLAAHGLHPGRAKKMAILAGVVAVGAIVALVVLKPWDVRTTTKTEFVPSDPLVIGDPKRERENAAENKFLAIEMASFKDLGKVEESWKDGRWEKVVRDHTDLAKEYEGTEAAKKATEKANEITTAREQRRRADEALAAARDAARSELKAAVDKGLEAAKAPGKNALAAATALTEAEDAATKLVKAKPGLLTEDEVRSATKPLVEARKILVMTVNTAWLNADTDAKRKSANASTQAFNDAILAYDKWIDAHAATTDEGDVAKEWNAATASATKSRAELVGKRDRALRREILADRGAYFDWLVKEAYAPRNEDGSGGGFYVRFQFAPAAERAAVQMRAARLAGYKELFAERQREATLLSGLTGSLVASGTKGFKEKIAGNGWTGSVKSFTADAVQLSDGKVRLFADEGFSWFYRELFYDKGGQERFPLDADAHEALAVLMEAAGILEPSPANEDPVKATTARFDAADMEWDKAAALDPSRKDLLARRKERAASERAARRLLDESDKLRLDADTKIAGHQRDIVREQDLTKADVIRKTARDAIDALRETLAQSHAKLEEVALGFATTIVRALLEDTAPEAAAYAGETLPPAEKTVPPPEKPQEPGDKPTAPPTPTVPPASPPANGQPPLPAAMDDPPPAMADVPAMDDTPIKPAPVVPPAMGDAPPR